MTEGDDDSVFGMDWYTLSGASNAKKKGGYGVKEIVGILSGCRNKYSECNTAVARNVIGNVDTAITIGQELLGLIKQQSQLGNGLNALPSQEKISQWQYYVKGAAHRNT